MPRLLNPVTGTTEMAVVPWAEGLRRWSKRFEAWAIDLLLHTQTVSDGSRLLRLGWESCDRVMERAVERGLKRRTIAEVKLEGIDEKCFRAGGQDYIALMIDLGARVLEVVPGGRAKGIRSPLANPARTAAPADARSRMDRGKTHGRTDPGFRGHQRQSHRRGA